MPKEGSYPLALPQPSLCPCTSTLGLAELGTGLTWLDGNCLVAGSCQRCEPGWLLHRSVPSLGHIHHIRLPPRVALDLNTAADGRQGSGE